MKEQVEEPDIVGVIKGSSLAWAGYILRKIEVRLAETVYESLPQAIRPLGWPRASWKDQVHKDIRKMGLEEEDAGDRERWWRIVGKAQY